MLVLTPLNHVPLVKVEFASLTEASVGALRLLVEKANVGSVVEEGGRLEAHQTLLVLGVVWVGKVEMTENQQADASLLHIELLKATRRAEACHRHRRRISRRKANARDPPQWGAFDAPNQFAVVGKLDGDVVHGLFARARR